MYHWVLTLQYKTPYGMGVTSGSGRITPGRGQDRHAVCRQLIQELLDDAGARGASRSILFFSLEKNDLAEA